MPPAFNLSQDQTLQFNLCFKSLLTWSLTQNTDEISYEITFNFVRAFEAYYLSIAPFGALAIFKRPHLSTVDFLKIAALSDKSLCLSAAEKRDYVVNRLARQPYVFSASRFLHLATLRLRRCEGQNYSEPQPSAQE